MTRFDVGTLANPDAFHWPGYFWLWNDVLERETLFGQLRDLDSVGAKNVWILPVPTDFRPKLHEDQPAARVPVGVPRHP